MWRQMHKRQTALAILLVAIILSGCALMSPSSTSGGKKESASTPTPLPYNVIPPAVAQAMQDWLTQNPSASWIRAEKAFPVVRSIDNLTDEHAPPIKLVIGAYFSLGTNDRVIGLNLGAILAKDSQGKLHVFMAFATYDNTGKPLVLLPDDNFAAGNYVRFGFENPPMPEDPITEQYHGGKYDGSDVVEVFRWLNAYNATTPNAPTFGRLDTAESSIGGLIPLVKGTNTVGRLTNLDDLAALNLSDLASNPNRGTVLESWQSSTSQPPSLP